MRPFEDQWYGMVGTGTSTGSSIVIREIAPGKGQLVGAFSFKQDKGDYLNNFRYCATTNLQQDYHYQALRIVSKSSSAHLVKFNNPCFQAG